MDVELASKILELIDAENKRLNKRVKEICGFRPTQRDKVLDWCKGRGAKLTSLSKGAIEEYLRGSHHIPSEVEELFKASNVVG